jgi:membrane peptidoglycan carboxypeptidase
MQATPGWLRERRHRALLAIGAAVALLVVSLAAYTASAMQNLPQPGHESVLARSIVVYDRTGKVIAERNPKGEYHVVLKLSDMGAYNRAATLAAEDRDFYSHGAVDPGALARAALVDVSTGQAVEGGSTITEQLVKIQLLSPQKSVTRKLNEAFLAWTLEHRYSKDQILEMYLNRVYYGHGAYGIGSAAKTYFGKDARSLDAAQAALLAGLIQAPSGYDPQLHFDLAKSRQEYVLKAMVQTHALSQDEADRASKEDLRSQLKYDTSYRQSRAPHFVDYVIERLEAEYGSASVQQGGLAVYTTLDPDLQALAERSVRDGVAGLTRMGVNNGDLLAVKPSTGEILAWVGSADYGDESIGGQFDVVRSPRQPGSSFKPYVYEAALRDKKLTLASCLSDTPTDFNGYRPVDFDNSYMGRVSARQALVLSRNIPAVQVAQKEGIGNVIDLARQMGVRGDLQPVLSTAIGGSSITMFDHVQGYQVFADQGQKMPLMAITRVVDSSGRTIFDRAAGSQPGRAQVLQPAEAYLITDTLKAYQNQWSLGWNRQMASKSGTTGGTQAGVHPDAWMMAYNPDIVVGAWAGNTGPNGGGKPISAFGVNVGSSILREFINGLPASFHDWYATPPGISKGKSGEIYLAGTEGLQGNDCAGLGLPVSGGGNEQGGGGEKKKRK